MGLSFWIDVAHNTCAMLGYSLHYVTKQTVKNCIPPKTHTKKKLLKCR